MRRSRQHKTPDQRTRCDWNSLSLSRLAQTNEENEIAFWATESRRSSIIVASAERKRRGKREKREEGRMNVRGKVNMKLQHDAYHPLLSLLWINFSFNYSTFSCKYVCWLELLLKLQTTLDHHRHIISCLFDKLNDCSLKFTSISQHTNLSNLDEIFSWFALQIETSHCQSSNNDNSIHLSSLIPLNVHKLNNVVTTW